MKRIGFVFKIDPDKAAAYREHHQRVWPEMKAALRDHGWHNYSLFIRDNGEIFGYFETPDSFESALSGMADEPVNARWQALMAPYFEGEQELRPDEKMEQLEQIFFLE
jgi:L-rhamnose mutarotase